MKKLLLFFIAISCLCLCGCGGGGDSGNAVDPEKQQYVDVVMAFKDAVNNQNVKEAKGLIEAIGTVYYKSYDYQQFVDKLTNFLEKAETIEFSIPSGEIDANLGKYQEDDIAEVSAYCVINYTYKGEQNTIKEILRFVVEKGGKSDAGIRAYCKYDSNLGSDQKAEFPPVLE